MQILEMVESYSIYRQDLFHNCPLVIVMAVCLYPLTACSLSLCVERLTHVCTICICILSTRHRNQESSLTLSNPPSCIPNLFLSNQPFELVFGRLVLMLCFWPLSSSAMPTYSLASVRGRVKITLS